MPDSVSPCDKLRKPGMSSSSSVTTRSKASAQADVAAGKDDAADDKKMEVIPCACALQSTLAVLRERERRWLTREATAATGQDADHRLCRA